MTVLPIDAVRAAVVEHFKANPFSVTVGDDEVAVTVCDFQPHSGVMPDTSLPAVYIYCDDERVGVDGYEQRDHDIDLQIVMQTLTTRDDAADQLAQIYAQVDALMASGGDFGGVVDRCNLKGSRLVRLQGELTFHSRAVNYEINATSQAFAPE
jgi:hypothetical protein